MNKPMNYINKINPFAQLGNKARTLAESQIFWTFKQVGKDIPSEVRISIARRYMKTESSEHWESNFFDREYYAKQMRELKGKVPSNCLYHYITKGWRMGLRPTEYFDVQFYLNESQKKCVDVQEEPFQHYQNVGYKENLSPWKLFDNDWYRRHYRSDDTGKTPFEHFVEVGNKNKSDPSPFLSVARIEIEATRMLSSSIEAAKIYLSRSKSDRPVRPHLLFDDYFYLTEYTDVRESSLSALEHYTAYGVGEGRSAIHLHENKADLASPLDSRQFEYLKWDNYFQVKNFFYYAGLLDRLAHSGGIDVNDEARRPLAIITTFNDSDCIGAIVEASIREGLQLWIIDNWSSDGTWDILSELKSTYPQQIEEIERYPSAGSSDHYDWSGMLMRKEEIALQFPGRWILHQDSDEITVSPISNLTCAECLLRIGALGYNTVNMRMFDFRPTDTSEAPVSIEDHLSYFEFSNKPGYSRQIKAWIQPTERVDLASGGGHKVNFEGSTIFPLRLPRKHYAIRSVTHGRRKVFAERKPRFVKERTEKGWHTHYDDSHDDAEFIWNTEHLNRYSINGHLANWFEMLYNEDL